MRPGCFPLYLRVHSEGFKWGDGGSGLEQLALAVLADRIGAEQALLWYQRFKFEVVAKVPAGCWELMREEVLGWYRALVSRDRGA